ncbi:hypothetical protein FS837_003148 [Tulasnella sp. UAMH 9824]|nr:hypothetical protein FS837_003148 [Tulasnella sp. UAMH 9824]
MDEHEPWDDLRVIQYVEHEHLLVARDNIELFKKFRPFNPNFYPIMVEASKQLRRRPETDDNDETQSQLSDPDDATYVEEWDPGNLMAWMLENYKDAPSVMKELYSHSIKVLETRLQSRLAESQALESTDSSISIVDPNSDDAASTDEISASELRALRPRQLPPEILSEIFHIAVEDAPLMPITLSHVDRFHRHVAINLSRLWSTISIRLASPIVDLYLERSQSAPLFVDAMVPPVTEVWSIKTEQRCKGFLLKLKPHAHRVRVLKCQQFKPTLSGLSDILRLMRLSGLRSELTELELGETGEQIEEWSDSELPGTRHGESDAPAPQRITIHGAYSTRWTFQIISFTRLYHIGITDNSDLDFDKLLGNLRRAPNLESLQLVNCVIRGDEDSVFSAPSLPNLRSLELIHLTAPEIPFFDSLGTFPKLSSFTMTIVDVLEPNPEADLIRFVGRHPSIRTVYLHDFITTRDGWRLVLGNLVFATHLQLSACNLADDDISILRVPDTGDVLMPDLRHLTLDNELLLHSHTIARIVRDRLAAGSKTRNTKVQPLKSVTLRGWDASHMDPEDLGLITNSVEDFVLDMFGGDADTSDTESDLGTDCEYYWSDVDPAELAFDTDVSTA